MEPMQADGAAGAVEADGADEADGAAGANEAAQAAGAEGRWSRADEADGADGADEVAGYSYMYRDTLTHSTLPTCTRSGAAKSTPTVNGTAPPL